MKTSIATVSLSVALYAVTLLGTRHTPLGKRIRAVASNPFLAELTRLQPRRTYAVVMALASGLVAVPGMLVAFDLGLQPYTGTTVLLTGTVAVIAGGGGSVSQWRLPQSYKPAVMALPSPTTTRPAPSNPVTAGDAGGQPSSGENRPLVELAKSLQPQGGARREQCFRVRSEGQRVRRHGEELQRVGRRLVDDAALEAACQSRRG